MNFSLSPLAPENFISRETGSAVPPLVSYSFPTFRLNLVLTHGIRPAFLDGVHIIYIYSQLPESQSRVNRVYYSK